jgi:hypothetical protein
VGVETGAGDCGCCNVRDGSIAVVAAREPEVSSGRERDKTDGKPFDGGGTTRSGGVTCGVDGLVGVDRILVAGTNGV